jgi:hypothetical protein
MNQQVKVFSGLVRENLPDPKIACREFVTPRVGTIGIDRCLEHFHPLSRIETANIGRSLGDVQRERDARFPCRVPKVEDGTNLKVCERTIELPHIHERPYLNIEGAAARNGSRDASSL